MKNNGKNKIIDAEVVSTETITPGLQLLDIVRNIIKELYSSEQAIEFMKNPEFANWKEYDAASQRGLANRVLVNKLLIHRATNDVLVVDAIYCLMPDGDNASWMNVFKTVIVPFLKENKVKL